MRMKRIDRVFKKISELYEFNRKLQVYDFKKKADESLEGDAARDRRTSWLPRQATEGR